MSPPAAEDPVMDLGQFVCHSVCNIGSERQTGERQTGCNGCLLKTGEYAKYAMVCYPVVVRESAPITTPPSYSTAMMVV